MNDKMLVRTEEELKPTINQLVKDQRSYDPFQDNDYLEQGSFLLNRFSQAKKSVEEQRVAFTQPLNETLRNINKFFKNFSDPIEQADRELRQKLAKHRQVLEAKRLEEQRRVEKENEKLLKKAEKKGLEPVLHTEVPDLNKKIGAVVVKKIWTYEIKDSTKIPFQYLMVDEVKIREAIRAGARDIPGVMIFQKDEVSL